MAAPTAIIASPMGQSSRIMNPPIVAVAIPMYSIVSPVAWLIII